MLVSKNATDIMPKTQASVPEIFPVKIKIPKIIAIKILTVLSKVPMFFFIFQPPIH
jgi:hypothetical protein